MPQSQKFSAKEIAEAIKKKKKRFVETDASKKSWKALETGGLDPVEINEEFATEYESKLHPRAEKLPPRWMRKDREDIRKELKGMGPEGKRFLKDELSDRKYEGKLKPKYKKDLLLRLNITPTSFGMSYSSILIIIGILFLSVIIFPKNWCILKSRFFASYFRFSSSHLCSYFIYQFLYFIYY